MSAFLRSSVAVVFGLVSGLVGIMATVAAILVAGVFVVSVGFALLRDAVKPDSRGLVR